MTTWKLYREDGTVDDVDLERWHWEAHYTDGTILKQFDDNGHYHQFKEIEQSRLKVFGMVHDTLPPLIIYWREGLKLIHFYKNFHLEAFTENERKFKLYCFGYEGKNEKLIMSILPDDGVILTDDVDTLLSKLI